MIDNYCDVWDATKGTAGSLDLFVVLVKKVDACLIFRVGSGSALYRYAQDLLARWSTRDEIDSRMVYVSAFKAPFRKPVQDQGLAEVARDLGVAGTFLHMATRVLVGPNNK